MGPAGGVGLVMLLACMSITLTSTQTEPQSTQPLPTIQSPHVAYTQKEYSKLFRQRRVDHTRMIKNLQRGEYTKNYIMIEMAFEKIFTAMKETTSNLIKLNYNESEGFSTDPKKQEQLILLLESVCLAADIFLHFPEISFRTMTGRKNWRQELNWCIHFVDRFPITDKLTHQLMLQAYQEINEPYRDPEYVNPYYVDVPVTKKAKQRKKLKKGPGLVASKVDL